MKPHIFRSFFASYLRALAAVVGTLFVGSVTDWIGGAFWQKALLAFAGAGIAPVIKLMTDGANLLDDPPAGD